MSEEIWRACPSYPKYDASDQGRVRSWHRGGAKCPRIMKQFDTGYGYMHVRVASADRGGRHAPVHRMVLDAFSRPALAGEQCRHLDGVPMNNTPGNLVWGTAQENANDRIRHGTVQRDAGHWSARMPERVARGERTAAYTHRESRPRGERHGHAVMTDAEVLRIRARSADGESSSSIARDCAVSARQVRSIVSGRSWRHLLKDAPNLQLEGGV